MVFDWTISLGNLLTVVGFSFSGVVFVVMMRGDISALAGRLKAVEETLRELARTQLIMAETEGRVKSMDERITMVSQRLDRFMTKEVNR